LERLDIAIIGAGPAGTSAARRLSAYGFRTAVFEKASFPREKCCAGWLTPKVFEKIGVLPADYAREALLQPLRGIVVWDAGQNPRRFAVNAGWGICRREFDAFLAGRANADIRENTRARSLEYQKDGVLINNSVLASVVIGAGGHSCPAARMLAGAGRGDSWTVASLCTEGVIPARFMPGLGQWAGWPHIIFTPDFTGYGWFFVKGGVVNIGIGSAGATGRDVRAHLNWMLGLLRQRGIMPEGLTNELPAFRGHFYKLYGRMPRRIYTDRLILAGDAAGLASPFSGEGIGPAIQSGQLAAEAAILAIQKGRADAKDLSVYQDMIESEFGRLNPGFFGHLFTRISPFITGPVMRTVLSSSELTEKIIVKDWFGAF